MDSVGWEDDLLTGSDCSSTVVDLDDYGTYRASEGVGSSRSSARSSQIDDHAKFSEKVAERADQGQYIGGRYFYHDVRLPSHYQRSTC